MNQANDLFPETVNKGVPGTIWWTGNWECRNFDGYFQSREGGKGKWRFYVPWFSCDDVTCTVLRLNDRGEQYNEDGVPIDGKNRITINGRKYGHDHWDH